MKGAAMRLALGATERGWVPDALARRGIRALVRARLEAITAGGREAMAERERQLIETMDRSPIAPVPERANEQHYELPPAFFAAVLGHRLKYSCGYWGTGVERLDAAEDAALDSSCERAALDDGQRVLELGCGWGSLTLWMAERYPRSRITAVSNARSQRAFILARAAERRLANVEVVTADINEFTAGERFDRVVSVEMFEHMRNQRLLLERIHDWLRPGGRLFVHVFCHRAAPYAFTDAGPGDWMSRHFFTGGLMPSEDLLPRLAGRLELVDRWRWSGRHYARTAEAWLANFDRRRERVWPLLAGTYGNEQALRWWLRWRLFFMACAELFGYRGGEEWRIGHYAFERPRLT